MKKLLIILLASLSIFSCQNVSDYFESKSVIGKYVNNSGTTIELTDTKCIIGDLWINSYKVEKGYIYLDGEWGQITRFKIIDKNTLSVNSIIGNGETIYRRIGTDTDSTKASTENQNSSKATQPENQPRVKPSIIPKEIIDTIPPPTVHQETVTNVGNQKGKDTITDQNVSPDDVK